MLRNDRVKMLIVLVTIFGLLLAVGGAFLAYFFNFAAYGFDRYVRLAGLVAGLVLVLIGSHIATVGLATLRS